MMSERHTARQWLAPWWAIVGGLLVAAGNAQAGAGPEAAPPAKGHVTKGTTLFARHCAGCHGPEGKGDGYKLLGPDPAHLTAPSITKKSDTDLLKAIHKGRPNMPAWESRLSDEDSRDVLAYVRSLAKK
jgi:mono/diheme cytochrome c family protein